MVYSGMGTQGFHMDAIQQLHHWRSPHSNISSLLHHALMKLTALLMRTLLDTIQAYQKLDAILHGLFLGITFMALRTTCYGVCDCGLTSQLLNYQLI